MKDLLEKMLYVFTPDGELIGAVRPEDVLEFHELPSQLQEEVLGAWQ